MEQELQRNVLKENTQARIQKEKRYSFAPWVIWIVKKNSKFQSGMLKKQDDQSRCAKLHKIKHKTQSSM